MKGIAITIAILVTTALPSFAGGPAGCSGNGPGAMKAMMGPGMKQQMAPTPRHLLMRAYHENVAFFARTLAQVAGQGETVPKDVARTAIAEMRRSTEEMEKLRATIIHDLPAGDARRDQMQRMVDEHLVSAKTHIRELEELAKRDTIPSREVLEHLQFLSQGCGDSAGKGMPCGERHRRQHAGGCGCEKSMGMTERHQAMGKMAQEMRAEDADMALQVEKMNRAPRDEKVDVMAALVSRLVQQRARFTSHLEEMQQHMMRRHGGGMQHSGACLEAPAAGKAGEGTDEYDNDSDPDDMTVEEE